MNHIKSIMSFFGLLLLATQLFAQLQINVTSIPANTPDGASIYIAGTFNNWDAGNNGYTLSDNGNGTYQITVTPPAGEVKFKFTRGNWDSVEGNANGGFQTDHVVNYSGNPQSVNVPILSWEDLGGGTGGGNGVVLFSDNFYMPQLQRNRRIWVYLPPDYNTANKTYPVLYMHDAQNLFDPSTSFSGEWMVDESLNALFSEGDEGIIVVGIENGGGERINEYTPWSNPTYGGGDGDAYIDFIVETLKPAIDQAYRTRSDRENTGIMGSSLGGLVSMYGAIEHQDIFGKAGVLSPSFWFSEEVYTHVSNMGKQANMRIYLLAGEQESATMVSDLVAMYNTLINAGFSEEEILLETHPDGQHSEWYWAREFPDVYQWLFPQTAVDIENPAPELQISLSPNPADSILYLNSTSLLNAPRIVIYSADGRRITPPLLVEDRQMDVSFLKTGMYVFKIFSGSQLLGSQKIVIGQ
ncbi:MAG: hypothetical protein DHS20C18_22430 [Saprospiraceae bacterium]|nr:MAG: hypothetical protein DHS20C18_22430 [Saprospiraceae bacterium]